MSTHPRRNVQQRMNLPIPIDKLAAHLIQHRNLSAINKRLQAIDIEGNRLRWFYKMLVDCLQHVRQRAERHQDPSILVMDRKVLKRALQIPAMIPSFVDIKTVQMLIYNIRRDSDRYHEGELITVDEDTFLNTIETTLLHFYHEMMAERRRRFETFHEELIMKVMDPARIQRFADAAGVDFLDYIILME